MNDSGLSYNFKNYRVLVVDNDNKNRKLLAGNLLEMGFQVLFTSNTEGAKKILKNDQVDLLITEMHMPGESGIELIRWIRRVYDTSFKQNMPLACLMMTGFSHLMEKVDLSNLYLSGCLLKPIDLLELEESLLIALKIKEPETRSTKEEEERTAIDFEPFETDFCRVLLSDFNSHPHLEFDIYIQLSTEKFVRIAKKGEKISEIQFGRYNQKGIQFLFIRKSEFKKIVDFNMKLSRAVINSNDLSLEKKQRFLAKTGELILESAFVNGVNQETFEDAKDFLCTSIDTLIEDDEIFDLLEGLNQHSNSLYAHSLGVSIYSLMIAQKMGWKSGPNLFKLSFGGLMHDIGKRDFNPALLNKSKSDLTYDEKALLETHSERGKNILENLRSIPSEVIAIAYEHHENILGQGYPRFLKKNHISPMARIISVADEFCRFAIKNPDYPEADADKALHLLDQYKRNLLDHDAIMALRLVFQTKKKKRNKAS